jgi:hypothetical protein
MGRIYRPGYRGWAKIKNPGYWRRESEIAQMQRSLETQHTRVVKQPGRLSLRLASRL